MRLWLLGLFSTLILALGAAPAAAYERVALLIGNSAYQSVTPLANPTNDATDLAAALERVGFEVTLATDLDFVGMHKALQDFSRMAADADMALVYFAGHGVEIDKHNYLIPTDAELSTDRRIMLETISLDLVTEAVSGAKSLRMVLLDACRNNPFLGKMQMSTEAGRSIGRGLSPYEPTGGTLVAFAARDGTIAMDGSGRNSPFMKGLLAHIEEPGLDVNLLFRKVRDSVLIETDNKQEPFTYGSLPGEEIFLVPPVAVAIATPALTTPAPATAPIGDDAEEFAWNLVKTSTDRDALQGFIQTFPKGVHTQEAFARLSTLPPATESAALPTATPSTDAREGVPAPAEPDNTALVASIQGELRRAGCNPGPADGIWGNRSKRALTAFGRDSGLDIPSDEPDEDLLQVLQSKPGTVCVAKAAPKQTAPRAVEHEDEVAEDETAEYEEHEGEDDGHKPKGCFGFTRQPDGTTTFSITLC
jgi:hypothetical protein